jgi:hypothetical protein
MVLPNPIVANQAAARADGEQCALTLISVQRYPQKLVEPGTADPFGKRLLQPPAPMVPVAHLGNEAEHIIMAAQIRLDFPGCGEKVFESRKSFWTKYAAGVKKLLH